MSNKVGTGSISFHTVRDGADAEEVISGYLTNESIVLAADSSGNVLSYNHANGIFKVYEGTEEKTGIGVSYSVLSNVGAIGSINQTGEYAVSSMTNDTGMIRLRAAYNGFEIVKEVSLSKSRQGQDGISTVTLVLTNESHTVPAHSNGEVISYDGAETEIYVYRGTTDVTEDADISFVESLGIIGSLAGNKYTITELTEDSAFVNIKAEIDGIEVSKRMSLVKSKGGYSPIKNVDYFDGEDAYSVEIISSEGNVFRNGTISSTLEARVKKGSNDITDEIPATNFIWQRTSKQPTEDEAWNLAHASGAKVITITDQDVYQKATFTCTVIKD